MFKFDPSQHSFKVCHEVCNPKTKHIVAKRGKLAYYSALGVSLNVTLEVFLYVKCILPVRDCHTWLFYWGSKPRLFSILFVPSVVNAMINYLNISQTKLVIFQRSKIIPVDINDLLLKANVQVRFVFFIGRPLLLKIFKKNWHKTIPVPDRHHKHQMWVKKL